MSKKPTLGKEWRKPREEGFLIELPSGNVAKLRPVALDRLILAGKIPDLLTAAASKLLWVETSEEEFKAGEVAKNYTELVNLIVPAAMISPVVVDNPTTEHEISLDDIDFQDKITIFQLATGPTEALRRFRDFQAGNVATVPNGENNVQPSE